MAPEPPILTVLRETLEAVASRDASSAIVFEMLDGARGRLPTSPDGWAALIDGPLRAALSRRLSREQALVVLRKMRGYVSTAEATTNVHGTVSEDTPRPASGFHALSADGDPPTRSFFPLRGGPAPVVIFARSRSLLVQLRVAIGPRRIAPELETHADRLVARCAERGPSLLLVDVADLPTPRIEAVAAALASTPAGLMLALWGSELENGRKLLRALESRGVGCVDLDRAQGVDPLLDLVRSRSHEAA